MRGENGRGHQRGPARPLMPWLLLPCPGGCGRRVASGRCSDCARVASRNHPGRPRQLRGLDAEYDRMRPLVLAEEPVCWRPGCGRRSTTVDHVVPRHRGGTNERANLRGSCTTHNYGRR